MADRRDATLSPVPGPPGNPPTVVVSAWPDTSCRDAKREKQWCENNGIHKGATSGPDGPQRHDFRFHQRSEFTCLHTFRNA